MALTSEELDAAKTIAGDVAQIAVELYAALSKVHAADLKMFDRDQAFELTKILIAYAVNETDDA
jgi:hypothetical protein